MRFENYQEKLIHEVDVGYRQWTLKKNPEWWNEGDATSVARKLKHQRQEEVIYNVHNMLTDLKSCSIRRDIRWGRRIHSKVVKNRQDSNIYVVAALIKMYAKCGSMEDARRVFVSIQRPDVVCWNALLLGYAQNANGLTTLELFARMKACGCAPNSVTYIAALKSCTSLAGNGRHEEWLERGRQIHSEIGCYLDISVENTLIDMYSKCRSMIDAHRTFDSILKPDVVSWTALLLGYARNGDGAASLELFSRMKACGCEPNSVTYMAALKACTSLGENLDGGACLQRCRDIHSEIGSNLNNLVQNTLIDVYAKCGSMVDARCMFDSIQKPDVVCWNVLLLGYAENGDGLAALELFLRMKACDCAPNSVTYIAALKACTSLAKKQDGNVQGMWLKRGRELHSEIGDDLDIFLQNTLIDMYSKCGSMVDARSVFDSIQNPAVVSWTALLGGYAENGDGQATLEMFSKMKACGCAPNSVTYIAALKACSSLAKSRDGGGQDECLKRGREIHSEVGDNSNILVQNTLIDMYAKCGSMVDARRVFENISKPSVVSWTILLLGYTENGDGLATLEMFSRMKACGCVPDSVTYVAALKACTLSACQRDGSEQSEWLKRGKQLHSEIGCDLDILVQNTLIDMYTKCGSMVDARRVFDSVQKPEAVCWNILLLGYVENGDGLASLDLFSKMKAFGCSPNSVTYIAAAKACSSLVGKPNVDCLKLGREIHSEIGFDMDISVQNTFIDMYKKCGSMVDARRVFDSIPNPDVVSWTALLLGYVENGEGLTTLDMFSRMEASGCTPDSVAYVAALKACGLMGALSLGRKFHSEISIFTSQVVTCLVDFYAKCGSIVEARAVFDAHLKARDVATWTALLTGYGSLGDTVSVFNFFKAMQDQGFQPDAVTFVCMLSCCGHAGLVEKAKDYFNAMPMQYGITPTLMHYNCMVDILGRANQLNEALAILQKLPCNPDEVTWMTLLGACRKWKNVEIGKRVFQALVDMDKKNTAAYALMAQIYGSRGMWGEQERVLEACQLKTPGTGL